VYCMSIDYSDLTVLIPVRNEEEAIGSVIDEVVSVGIPPGRILVVDGYSTDSTVEIARSKGVRVVVQEGKGKIGGVKTGLKHDGTRYVLVMDGDSTYPAKYIPVLYTRALRDGCSEVFGVRAYGRENIPLVNRFGNWALTLLFNILMGTQLRDVLTGMYLVRVDDLTGILYESRGFSIEAEIAAHIVSNGEEVCEEPIEYRERKGRKKLRVVDGFRIGLDMIRLAWRYNPVTLILLAASLLMIPGLILGGYVAYHYFFTGINYYMKGVVAIALTIVGFNSLLLGILALYLKRMEIRLRRQLKRLENIVSRGSR